MMSRWLTGYRLVLGGAALLAVVATALGLLPYIAAWQMTDAILSSSLDAGLVAWCSTFALVGVIGKALLQATATSLSHIVAYRLLHELRLKLVSRLARVPLGFISQRPSGSLRKILMEDVEQIEEGIAHAIPDLASGLAVPILSGLVLLWLDWRLGLAAMAMFPLLGSVYLLSLRASRPHMGEYVGAVSSLRAIAVQYVQGIKEIRTFLHTDQMLEEYEAAVARMERVGLTFAKASLTPMAVIYAGLRANILVLMPVGTLLFVSGSIATSELVLFLLLGLGMNAPLLKVVFTAGNFFLKLKGAGAQIATILDADEQPHPSTPLEPRDASIILDGVGYCIDGTEIVSGVSLRVDQGTTLALVGPSGAGKSTLARLLLRFADPDAGRILVGGVDLRQMVPTQRERMVTAVLQDAWLMNATIYENILSGRPEATRQEVEEAARAARVLEFAPDLSRQVGEGGRNLSGGQRQRVAIARAILRGSPIVILDEATAALDSENEVAVREALGALARGRTVVVIAHRLDTIRHAEQIAVIEQGKVAALGRHEELLTNSPVYRRLWEGYEAVEGWHLEPGAVRAVPNVKASVPPSTEAATLPAGNWARFLWLLGPTRRRLLMQALPLLFIEGMLAGAPVIAIWMVLDRVLAQSLTVPFALLASAWVGVCSCLLVVCNRVSHATLWRVQCSAISFLQRRIASHLRRVPLGVLLSRDTGSVEALITQHAAGINFVTPPAQVMRVLVGPWLSGFVLLLLDWRLALLTFALLPLFALALWRADRLNTMLMHRLVLSGEMLSARVLDYIQGLPTLRSLGEAERYQPLLQALSNHRLASTTTVIALMPAVAMGWVLLDAGFVVMLSAGGWMLLDGLIESRAFVLFLVVGLVFYAPIADAFDLSAQARLLQKAMGRVTEVLGLPILPEPSRSQRPSSIDVRFEDVHFSHGTQKVLQNLNLTFTAGQIHALTGPSGVGKSTVLHLIARFWDVEAGRITIGGVDVRNIGPELRSALVTVVFQQNYLFDMSIARNLRLANPDATDAELHEAARTAGCHDFIMSLPNGYETRVGEGGVRLSGGERQRIALARALLKDSPIVLLDEATASVDPDSEREIRQALASLCTGRTVIVIAHRPSTIQHVDHRIELGGERDLPSQDCPP